MKFLQDFHIQDVLKGGAQALSLKVLATIAGFLVSVTLGRFYGPEGVGIYTLMVSAMMLSTTLSTVGLDNAVIKYTSSNLAVKNELGATEVLRTAVVLVVILSISLAVLVWSSREFIAINFLGNDQVSPLLAIAAGSIICLAITRICSGGLKALGNIPAAQLTDGLVLPCGILACFHLLSGDSIERAAFSFLAGSILAAFIGVIALIKTAHRKGLTNGAPNIRVAWQLLSTGWPTLGLILGDAVTELSALIFLSHFSSVEDIGIFRVAWQIAFLVSFLTMATDSILTPKIAALHAQNDLKSLARVLKFNMLLITFFSIPVAMVLSYFPNEILQLFGKGFQGAAILIIILVSGQVVNGALAASGKVLIMTGHEKKSLLSSLFGAVLVVVLCLLLVPKYGSFGAAIAVAITISVRCISAVILVRIYLGINMITGEVHTPVK